MKGPLRYHSDSLLMWLASGRATLLLCMLLTGCLADAEHTNPLDPNSDDFRNEGTLAGEVIRLDGSGVADAQVRLDPGPHVAVSGDGGGFRLDGVPPGSYELSVLKEGFAAGRNSVQITLGEVTQIAKQVDALPVVSDAVVGVGRIARPAPQDELYLLDVSATVDDPDGAFDLDSIWVAAPSANYTELMQVTETPSRFRAMIAASDLSLGTLYPLVGRNIVISAKDRAGFSTALPVAVTRVIEVIPVTGSQSLTAGGVVDFSWQLVTLPYSFTYRVDVVRVLGTNIQEMFASQSGIDARTSTVRFEKLAAGDYFWTISVVDEFGNWSQSIPAGFSVP